MAGLLGHLSTEDAERMGLEEVESLNFGTKSCEHCDALMPNHYKFCGKCGVLFGDQK